MRIAVAGAGIGGLVAALALARLGHAVTVRERASELRPVGAGLQLSPNALDVLDRLGLRGRLSHAGVAADAVTLRAGRTGRALARVPVAAGDGRGYLSLLRADLQQALLDAVRLEARIELQLNAPVETAERTGGGWRLGVGGADGPFDLLVAADGVHSPIRRHVAGAAPRDTGSVAARLRAPRPAPLGIEAWLGSRRHAVSYPVAGGLETNLVLVVPSREADAPLGDVFASWDHRLRDLIAAGEALGTWPLLEHAPLWRGDRLALVGDAAHAMLPFAAQGAAMAIEDGWMLAVCLARNGATEAALQAYEALRAPRLRRVLQRVAFHRFVYHLPPPLASARDLVLAMTPPDRLRRQLSWLYDWRAPELA